jgi:hypothetical protein
MSDRSARSRSTSGAYVLMLPGPHFLFRDVIHQFFFLLFVFWIRDRVSDLVAVFLLQLMHLAVGAVFVRSSCMGLYDRPHLMQCA